MSNTRVGVAGIYEYPHRHAPDLSPTQIKALSARAALADAGLTLADVDALYDCSDTGRHGTLHFAEYLGIEPVVLGGTDVGGSSFEYHVADAVRALSNGEARVALLTYGECPRTSQRGYAGPPAVPPGRPTEVMEMPWGLGTVGNYALVAARHGYEFGTTAEQLAQIAVVTRRHAMRNPMAVAGLEEIGMHDIREITTEDVLGSPLIADPLHLLDCCLVTDGGGAVVLVAEDLAPDTRRPPVWVLGHGTAIAYPTNTRSITTSAAAVSGPCAFAAAGVTPDDIDVAMLYDSFTITVLMALEDLGFCPKGEGGRYVEDGRLAFDVPGAPALNTDGGGLSSTHPGMRGIFLIIEAVRSLRGESTSQVANAELALVHGNGVHLGTRHAAGTLILGNR